MPYCWPRGAALEKELLSCPSQVPGGACGVQEGGKAFCVYHSAERFGNGIARSLRTAAHCQPLPCCAARCAVRPPWNITPQALQRTHSAVALGRSLGLARGGAEAASGPVAPRGAAGGEAGAPSPGPAKAGGRLPPRRHPSRSKVRSAPHSAHACALFFTAQRAPVGRSLPGSRHLNVVGGEARPYLKGFTGWW